MAGNIVKWWKHKILGGYKQFSVQECTTDSEELMYHQVRASSSCSAPPDLLLVSDRENNIPLRSPVVNIITTTTTSSNAANAGIAHTAGGSGSTQKHHHHQQTHQQQHQQQQHGTKDAKQQQPQSHLKMSSKNGSSKLVNTQQQQQMAAHSQQQQQHQQQQPPDEVDGVHQTQQSSQQQQQTAYQRHSSHQQQHSKEERIRLEEFTCDVSVEGGRSTQPLQFSFTFYDLDGHHGKITKDDIVGIVYTIYESIGKSVVVPHCGSKTINVRLTVSPEGKTKAAANGKLKKIPHTGGMLESHAKGHGAGGASAGHGHGHGHGHVRRQHRYRPRKLIKSDDEDDDSNSEKEKEAVGTAMAATTATAAAATSVNGGTAAVNMVNAVSKSKSHASSKYNKLKMEQQQQQQQQLWYQRQQETGGSNEPQSQQLQHMDMTTTVLAANCQHDNLYENMTTNLKCCTKDALLLKPGIPAVVVGAEECRSCDVTTTAAAVTTGAVGHVRSPTDVYMKHASTRVKMLRKARKQKYQDHCLETRQRSLSVGSEACWYNRHALLQQNQQPPAQQYQLLSKQAQEPAPPLGDVVDGVQLRNPHKSNQNMVAQKRNSAECWKTALNRNDLISIIRESMEKNRLCFQMSGKPQANVSPIRQPQHQHQPLHSQSQQQQQQQQHHQHQQQHQPSQHRQRSNTVSKIPTLIANHSNSIINHSLISPNSNTTNNINNNNISNNTNSTQQPSPHNNSNSSNNNELNLHDNSNNSNSTSLYHPQPHIPIYHQQMAINPAVLAAQNGIIHGQHSKMNLCGYDSFLHATICGGGTSHSPPPPPPTATQLTPQISNQPTSHQQPIATVQPLMTALNAVPHLQNTPKVFVHSTTPQIKTSKILRSGSYSQQHTQHNSPQYHGYQRLSSSSAAAHHHQQQQHSGKMGALNAHNAPLEKTPVEQLEKWLQAREKCQRTQRKDNVKHYDNSLYAKLSEKLQESTLNAQGHNKENLQRRKHKTHRRTPAAGGNIAQQRNVLNSSSSNASGVNSVYPLIPIHGDPSECQNLLTPTTDDETSNEAPLASNSSKVEATDNEPAVGQVATATLVDLNDGAEDDVELGLEGEQQAPGNGVDDEEDEEDLEEELDVETEASGSSTNANSGAATNATGLTVSNSSSASLIHRYVHEHIHHHYHHFEEKDE